MVVGLGRYWFLEDLPSSWCLTHWLARGGYGLMVAMLRIERDEIDMVKYKT